MPITSSRFWSITGKRECAVAMICGMNFSTGSWMSMKSTCARGTMMSRTCISETVRAPSMIESASASSRLREYAERSRCTSCSRSPGSRMSSDDRRSSRLGREGSFIAAASFYRVRVTETRARQQPDLEARHALGFPFLFMLVAAILSVREGQYVGRVPLPSVLAVQPAAFGGADDAQGDLEREERSPLPERAGARQSSPVHFVLHENLSLLLARSFRR